MKSPAGNKPTRRCLLDLHDVADELSLSRDTIDRMLKRGAMPFIRLPGGRRRVLRSDLEALIVSWKVEKA